MEAILSQPRILPTIAAFVVGIGVSLLIHTPFGLLAPIVALCLFASGRTGLLLRAASWTGLVGSLLIAAFCEGERREFAAMWAAFFALAICIGALLATRMSTSPGAEAMPVAIRSMAREAPPSYPAFGHILKERAALGASPAVSRPAADDQANIHDLVTTQETVHVREQQLQQLIDTVPAAIWCTTPEGIPCYLNKRATVVTGLTLRDLIAPDGSRSLTIVHPDDRGAFDRALAHSFKTGTSFVGEYRQLRADGTHRWVESSAEPLRDDSGNIVQWYGVTVDIHDLVTAQEALRNRERELSQLVDMVPGFLSRFHPDGEPNFLNKRGIDFLGLDVADFDKAGMSRLATALAGVIHPDDAAGVTEALTHSFATGEPVESTHRLRRHDSVYRWVSSRVEPMRDESGRIIQWYGVGHDIDDQVRLYRELEEREAKFRRLVDSDIIGIVIWDIDGTLIDANDSFLRMLQYDREDVKAGLRWFDMTPPEWQEVHAREEAEELARTGKMQAREKEYFRKDGSRVPVLIGGAFFEGHPTQGVAFILDLTERKRAESAVRDRERELAQLVDMLPVHIGRLTPEGQPIFFNKRLTDFTGVDVAKIGAADTDRVAAAIESLVHPDEAANFLAARRYAVATGEGYAMRYRLRRADGVYRWMEVRTEPLRNQNGTIAQWYSVSIDIEDEVRAQQAEAALRETTDNLSKATYAASLAELSASIAHEVNQPLAAIVFNAHASQRWLSADPPNVDRAKIMIDRVVRDANAAADVVSRIRALFKQSIERKETASFSRVIAEAQNLMAEEATRSRVRMDVDVEDELPLITFDRVQVQQVLVNLMRNGMDAMTSVTENRVLGMRVRRMDDVVKVEISDRGPGAEFPDKIFDPFFTTKDQGMGMGLAICRSIVESHGGRLWMERNEPQGTRFIFTLPVEVNTAT